MNLRPTLISLLPLPIARVVSSHGDVKEVATHLAFDAAGAVWFLIQRVEPLPDPDPEPRPSRLAARLRRITFARFQLAGEIPFDFQPLGPFTEGRPAGN